MQKSSEHRSRRYYACVYGGASARIDKKYLDEITRLGAIIAQNGFSLVYGAGASGCMGAAASGVREQDGYVMGVSPHFIKSFEPIFDCDNTVMVDTMAERKMIMEKHADIFFIAPGGIGTMDEFFQILTLKYLRQISAPIVVLNLDGFYDSLLALMDSLIENKAAVPEAREFYDVVTSVDDPIITDYFSSIKNG
ncbi:MAG TPA: TIGR00730 family Rossman fold protein [Candidatus Faeciplasma avium]|uniref:Cytokinin riboside 5'-monophosphate phosphoribohydrolase n=1 Tax=Candidatus Faeciplasma avium TaxID=2840798 RepID=A0A9D1NP47_9FIRM|nr:TIGR00730 family Rossman fold protein [Candidatus Faeciplasma avium]